MVAGPAEPGTEAGLLTETRPVEETRPLMLEDTLGFRLSRLARALRQDYARRLAPLGIGPPRAAVLRAVDEAPGCSLRGLARRLGSEPMATKRLVDDLERSGLLQSEPELRGRRRRALVVTEEGHRIAQAARAAAGRQQSELAALIGPEGLDQLEALLGRLESRLVAGAPDAQGSAE